MLPIIVVLGLAYRLDGRLAVALHPDEIFLAFEVVRILSDVEHADPISMLGER
jgi:hypothetical protein